VKDEGQVFMTSSRGHAVSPAPGMAALSGISFAPVLRIGWANLGQNIRQALARIREVVGEL